MKYLVVIDTNVIVSALLSKHSDASTVQVINTLLDNIITPIINDEILAEYSNVLHRNKFHFPESTIQATLHYFQKYGIYADRLTTNELLPDPKDLVFYEVCMAKREEDSMLVTGNMKHFPAKPFIVTPNELLEIISKNV
ncbi:MAG: putative toxin-antitoxin system toxin component, PIN family [Lachnospiraceae bacterium]